MADPKSQEPSMEEILASIRRIIADDTVTLSGGGLGPVTPPSIPQPSHDEVLVLTDMLEADGSVKHLGQGEPAGSVAAASQTVKVAQVSSTPEPAATSPPPDWIAQSAAPLRETREDALVSRRTAAASSDAFSAFSQAAAARDAVSRPQAPLSAAGPSLEALVNGQVRQLLHEWLEQHLPSQVAALMHEQGERLMRDESARLVQDHGENLLREALTPMLRDWLELHLAELVERLVRQEIEKLSHRGEPG